MKKQVIAIANIIHDKMKGSVEFYEVNNSNKVMVHVLLSGLKRNSIHGFHIHEAGDLSDNCISACAHFNPYNKNQHFKLEKM
jgi:Cu-Zn family superoxide dismutase